MASGVAARPQIPTVTTITRNVVGRSLSAPTRPSATNGAEKFAAVDAATMPAVYRPDEDALVPGQLGADGRQRSDCRPDEQYEAGHRRQAGPLDATKRRRGHRGRDRDEQHTDGELDDRLEERPVVRHEHAPQVGAPCDRPAAKTKAPSGHCTDTDGPQPGPGPQVTTASDVPRGSVLPRGRLSIPPVCFPSSRLPGW